MTAFAESLAPFFDPSAPGVVAATINGTTVYGSFEQDYNETLDDGRIRRGVPMFLCERSALPSVDVGDSVTVGARVYVLREVEADDFDPLAILHLNNP